MGYLEVCAQVLAVEPVEHLERLASGQHRVGDLTLVGAKQLQHAVCGEVTNGWNDEFQ